MKRSPLLLFLLLAFFTASSQEKNTGSIRLYLDCQSYCDQDYIKREIPVVDYVNDRFQSNIYILVNSQVTGSGGREYQLQFLGRENFEGVNDTLSFIRQANATDDESRQQMAQTIKLGLVKYFARTESGKDVQIVFKEDNEEKSKDSEQDQEDPWNLWVFNINLNGYLNGDQNYFTNSFMTGLSASRVSEELKTTTRITYNINTNRYGEGDDAFKFSNESYRGNHTTVWSLSEHWSAGGFVEAGRSDFSNYDSYYAVSPAVEYNLFPYKQSNNHYVGLMYKIGPSYFNYREETIYLKTEELRFQQNLTVDVSLNKKWGQVSGSASFGHYFHDFSKNKISFSGYTDLRLYKGLSLNFNGFFAIQRDQLNIAKGNITNEDLLTRRRQLDSNYYFYTSFGLRYRFGSIFNNVVNPRFNGGGGAVL